MEDANFIDNARKALKDLQPCISKTNNTFPIFHSSMSHFKMALVLLSSRAHPAPFYGLVTNLHNICAANGVDQSKVEYSKHKPVFGAHFRVVGVPFHRMLRTMLLARISTVRSLGLPRDLRFLFTIPKMVSCTFSY